MSNSQIPQLVAQLHKDPQYIALKNEYLDYSVKKICNISWTLAQKYFSEFSNEIQLEMSYNIDGPLIADKASRRTVFDEPKNTQNFDGKWYFITLTTDREGAPAHQQLQYALLSIITSKIYCVDKYFATWELTEAGRPHIHVLMRITKDTPKIRDLKKFNDNRSVDMKKQNPKEIVKTLQYMKKQDGDQKLIDFLKKYNEPKYRGQWQDVEDSESTKNAMETHGVLMQKQD